MNWKIGETNSRYNFKLSNRQHQNLHVILPVCIKKIKMIVYIQNQTMVKIKICPIFFLRSFFFITEATSTLLRYIALLDNKSSLIPRLSPSSLFYPRDFIYTKLLCREKGGGEYGKISSCVFVICQFVMFD